MSSVAALSTRLYRALFARPLFRGWNQRLFELSLHGLGILNYENDHLTGEAHLIGKVLPSLLGEKPIIFDVGANVGEYSAALLAHLPEARIHAFEPHPLNREKFVVPADETRLVLHPCALGEAQGQLTLFDRADYQGSAHASLYRDVISEIHKQEVTAHQVSVETVDDVARQQGVERIDLLKIDVEGHEMAVLEGAAQLLARNAIRFIQIEFNELNIISRVFFRDFRLLLPDHEFYRLLPRGMIRLGDRPLSTELFAFQNILAMPRDRL